MIDLPPNFEEIVKAHMDIYNAGLKEGIRQFVPTEDEQRFISRLRKDEDVCKKEHGDWDSGCISQFCWDRKAMLRIIDKVTKK